MTAARWLPSLPSMYPSLTHVHVGVQCEPSRSDRVPCAEWDAALLDVRTKLSSVWCDSVDDVVACREDVAWRRSVGPTAAGVATLLGSASHTLTASASSPSVPVLSIEGLRCARRSIAVQVA